MRYYFLREDVKALGFRIEELRNRVKQLGKEQGIAAAQSTENFGHDDACQEVVTYDRNVILGQLQNLTAIMNQAEIIEPKCPMNAVRFGAIVGLSDGRTIRIGSYMIFAEHFSPEHISYNSPLARAMLGKKVGEEFEFRNQTYVVKSITASE